MNWKFLNIDGGTRLAYIYDANGFRPEVKKALLKKTKDGLLFQRSQDIAQEDKPTEKPLAILVHDFPNFDLFYGSDNLAERYAERLKGSGFACLRFHFRGCGESDGDPQDFCMETALQDLRELINWAKKEKQHDRIVLIAAGLGANVALQCYDNQITVALSLLWPVIEPMKTPLNDIDTLDKRKYMAEHGYINMDGGKIGFLLAEDLRYNNALTFLPKIQAKTQIQQGTEDTYTSFDLLTSIREKFPNLRDIAAFEDGEHYLPNEGMRNQMIDNSLYFLERYAYHHAPGYIKTYTV